MAVRKLKSGARIKDGVAGYGLTEADLDVTYVGATLGTWEVNGYNDSDFYALVWTGESLASVEYATTRGWTYANSATVDATDEVKAAAAEWLAERDIASWNAAAAHDALMVNKGDTVEVVRGRKVPIGTTGEVIWIGADKYDRTGRKQRLGVKDGDGEVHWTAESNVRLVGAGAKMTSLEEIVNSTDARCKRLAESGQESQWVSAYRSYGGAMGRYSVDARDIDALLAETGRVEIDAVVTAIRLERSAREAVRATAEAEWEAEMEKSNAERDHTRLVEAGITAGIYTGDEADVFRARAAAVKQEAASGGSLMDMAAEIERGS